MSISLVTTVGTDARQAMVGDKALGAGNFLATAIAASPAPDAGIIWLEQPCRPFDGEALTTLSLNSLQKIAHDYARWYHSVGVKPKDPVGVYLDDGVEYLIHYLALVSLGAIPVLTNGNMPPEIAAGHFKRVGCVGVFLDINHQKLISPYIGDTKSYRFVVTDEDLHDVRLSSLPPLPTWFPFRHSDLDPIMIAHSSGTTGIPKAVLLQHQGFFYGIRYRLGVSSTGGAERILSALPHSHNCAIAYIMLALLSGNPVYVTSDHTGRNLAKTIESFKPTMVVSFPQTYVEFTEEDLDRYDLSSVRFWFNGGDAAHEQHIRKLVSLGSHAEGDKTVSGSFFIDGMGSSEMGFSLFRQVHHKNSHLYDRCVGTTIEWAEAGIFGDEGERLPAYVVGRLAVKAPSVTSGYWNDTLLTHRSMVSGFWLTGDLAYQDEEGRFFHVDRVPDLVRTIDGPFYTLQTEELLLKNFPELADCSLISVPAGNGYDAPLALIRLRPFATKRTTEELTTAFNELLATRKSPLIAAVEVATPTGIPLGTTGKVLKRQLRDLYKSYLINKQVIDLIRSNAKETPVIVRKTSRHQDSLTTGGSV